ncbi:MAG: cob(I)alamin adenosyltransferase [Candidatus Azotimanducaceae bacterium]|jgi:cob(I)alamin adenosyltransferase
MSDNETEQGSKEDKQTHKDEMQKVQAAQRKKRLESKKADRGLVLVHTGNGKGKSSSAFGVIIRALGWGHKVGVVQYVKGTWKTGEKNFFNNHPVDWHTMGEGFTWDTQDKERDIAAAKAAFEQSALMMKSGEYDLILLDEINIVLRYDYLDVQTVIEAVEARHERTSVILTGRDAKDELIEVADLVTEMKEIKHPYQAGIRAKQGIDF